MRKLAFLAGLAVVNLTASAEQPLSRDEEGEMALAFIRCSGLYQAMADVVSAGGKPSAAEHLRGLGRGAQTAALWTYAANYAAQNPDDPKPLGAWSSYVEPQIETEKTRFLGLMEFGDSEAMKTGMDECTALNKAQAEIVGLIRDESRPQGKDN